MGWAGGESLLSTGDFEARLLLQFRDHEFIDDAGQWHGVAAMFSQQNVKKYWHKGLQDIKNNRSVTETGGDY